MRPYVFGPMFTFRHFCRNDSFACAISRAGRSRAMNELPAILVVEDDHFVQSVVEEALTDGGFEIAIASSARQAIELLDGAGGKYRALVTDISLGSDKMDG